MIACPDCGARIQVPPAGDADETGSGQGPTMEEEGDRSSLSLHDALTASRQKIARLSETLEEMRKRRSYLERLRSDNLARFERLGDELAVIQSALDRMVGLLQDAVAESDTPSDTRRERSTEP